MEWNVKNANSRDVERQQLNKILKEIRDAVSSAMEAAAYRPDVRDPRDIVGGMVSGNKEVGISVDYNPTKKVLDFTVAPLTVRLVGDVTGEATVPGLGVLEIQTTSTGSGGISDAPMDGPAYWRRTGEWEAVPSLLDQFVNISGPGLLTINQYSNLAVSEIEGVAGEIEVDNGDGALGNPTIGLADVADVGGGTLQKTDFDSKGRKIGTSSATTDDLSEGDDNLYYTDARADARITLQKGQPNGLATLDAGAKLEANQLPALAITETFVVATEAAMLALTAQQGDVAVRTDETKSYILTAEPATTLANWQELLSPTGMSGTVTSVALSAPTGFTVSGSPVTSSGTLNLTYSAGYQGYTTTEATKLAGIATGATVGATWGTNLSNIPANITAWAATAPSDFVNTSSNQSVGGEKTFTGNVGITGSSIVLVGDGNRHIYFRNTDNTNRGLIFSEGTTGRLVYRAYDTGGIIYSQFILTPAGSATINGSEIWHASNFDPASKADVGTVVTTSGNQTGLSGNKVWTGAHQVGSLAVAGPNIAVATNGNGHLWFREADNTTVRGLVYSDSTTRRLILRSYGVGGAGYTQLLGDVATGTWTIDNNTIWHAGNLADTGWIAPTLLNSWVNAGGGFGTAGYRRFGKYVKLRGAIAGGTATPGTVLFNLPAGYRPSAHTLFIVPEGVLSNFCRIEVQSGGNVIYRGGATSASVMYLDGISFYND